MSVRAPCCCGRRVVVAAVSRADVDIEDFGRLVGRDASRVDAETVDPRGQYKSVVDAVKKAGSGDVGFYEVALDATRTEYFVVSVDAKGKRLVGLKALAVQS